MLAVIKMISGTDAIDQIEKAFPEISEEIREDEGLLHLQIGEFSHLAQAFIDNENTISFSKMCELFESLFNSASPELENALNVSFLEHLNFKDGKKNRKWAYNAMPPKMKKAWEKMQDYNSKIHGSR